MTAQPIDAPRGFVAKADYFKALARIEELEAELREAREQIVEATGAHVAVRMRLALPSLTYRECGIISALYQAKGVVPFSALFSAGNHRNYAAEPLDPYSTVKTTVCFARKKLSSLGAPDQTIQSYYGHGYALSRFGRGWLADRLSLTTGHLEPITGQV